MLSFLDSTPDPSEPNTICSKCNNHQTSKVESDCNKFFSLCPIFLLTRPLQRRPSLFVRFSATWCTRFFCLPCMFIYVPTGPCVFREREYGVRSLRSTKTIINNSFARCAVAGSLKLVRPLERRSFVWDHGNWFCVNVWFKRITMSFLRFGSR